MLKKQICIVFGFVFVLVAGQQRPSRPPKPPRLSGSYSDYPGLLVNKNPIQTNRQQNVQNNVLPPPRVSSVSSSSNVVRKPSGPIVIPAASNSYRGLPNNASPMVVPPSNASPMVVPPQSSTYNGIPRSAQGIPVSVIAAAELSQQYEKPKAPIKTGTDTWTPMGFTGDGKSFDMSTARPKTGSNKAVGSARNVTPQPQPVPYDTTASKKTIGQQIIERQQKQQQQQPQQYDIFGFPIDNSPGKSQYRVPQNPDLFEVIVNTIDMQNDQSRLRRHAVRAHPNGIVEPNKGFYPPKPPKDLPKPARRRPPPPQPLQEEMFQNQQETVQPKTNSKSRYSGSVSPTPGKKVKKNNETPAKYNEKPIPATTSTPVKSAKPTKSKNNQVPKEKEITKTTPKPIVKPKITNKSKLKLYVKSKAVNHETNAANTLELGESPKEALNAEAGLEFQALISGGADAAHEHGHGHEHAPNDHSHAHAHTHPEPHQPKPANGNNGPPPEMQAKFSSMFNAWYNAKFGADTPTTTATPTAKPVQTKQPSKKYTSKKKPGPVTKSVDKTALFEEFMTMFESQLNAGQVAKPTTQYPGKVTTKPVITKAPTQSPTTTTVAPATKAAQPMKSISKSKAAKESYAKSPNAKFGPRKKTDYIKPTTPVYPIVQTTSASANDPTLVKLVTLSHPESLAYPLDTNATSGGNSNMTLQQGGATPPAENTGFAGLNTDVITRGQKPVNRRLRTTTVRPTPDPDLLADINEARVMQGLPEVQAHQVDLQGNLLPFYQRQMRIGRLPARPHPLHNPGGIHHQLQHQHEVPHYHPEQGLGAGFNSFQQLFYPQHTNNGAVMAYEPFPRPNIPVPTTAAPNSHAADPLRNTGNVAPLQMVDAGPLNPLAYFYFISALNNLLQPQNNGRYQQLYQNGNGQNFNGQIHGELGGIPNSLDLHHQAIHMEAGNAMTPHLHRQVHRLLRNRELSRQRGNMFGMQPNFPPAVTQTPFIDPDLYADMMEAQAAAMAG